MIFRQILKLLLLIFLILFGFIATLWASFVGIEIYMILTILISIATVVFFSIWLFSDPVPRYLDKGMGIFLAICALAVLIYQGNQYYINNLATVNDEFNLEEYRPHIKDTKAVHLDTASTLKLNTNLPVMDGATALYPLYSAFAMAVYPKGDYPYNYVNSTVSCSNTIFAYESLVEGKSDVIFVAGPSKEQSAFAKKKGVKLVFTPIGKEAFVFFVNAKNKVSDLTFEQIKGIYSGKINNWKEVGGGNSDIKPFQRPDGSGSQTMLIKVMKGTRLAPPLTNEVKMSMGRIIDETANYLNYRNAMGFSFLYFVTGMVKNKDIKIVSIDGIYPDKNTIGNDSYPFTAAFYAVTTDKATPNTRKLIEWVLSPQGQQLVERTGYVPIRH
ncbi:PstS family phosphate ABC transporter substrate-binding protein [Pedobacter metabolipauper]|uniref:Phosphate transport system substrate-binding protein n=1 Tax=Pedobacter metabolipauper TaxID=425513 RepID=A0A4R6SU06_9SPHI|nr:substrate-binding domain-containing protein [Pedobacter metabolipauper]TDQ07116.1 phosphate transport system substrate-binding protein [Pedobacter metabolipauper]